MFNIGNLKIKNNIVLAPMAGISNPAFIKIVEEMGAGLAFTELISAEAIIRDNKKTFDMLNGIDKLSIPVGVQLFGSNSEVLKQAAKIIVDKYNVKLIDINMGCPVPKVAVRSEAGSALLKNPEKVKDIISTVSQAVDVPVTVKIRSGWDNNSINAVEIAKICEQAGAKAISIHARTRAQGYTGTADWSIIKAVKNSVNIPVIGNGDVKKPEDFFEMLLTTGCDAVMIGRALLGNPWLIKQICEVQNDNQIKTYPNNIDKLNMIKKHYNLLLENKPEKLALLEIRSHALWYIKGMYASSEIKNKLMASKSSKELFDTLDHYYDTCS